jgi:hypothetical protein
MLLGGMGMVLALGLVLLAGLAWLATRQRTPAGALAAIGVLTFLASLATAYWGDTLLMRLAFGADDWTRLQRQLQAHEADPPARLQGQRLARHCPAHCRQLRLLQQRRFQLGDHGRRAERLSYWPGWRECSSRQRSTWPPLLYPSSTPWLGASRCGSGRRRGYGCDRQAAGLLGHRGGLPIQDPALHEHPGSGACAGALTRRLTLACS